MTRASNGKLTARVKGDLKEVTLDVLERQPGHLIRRCQQLAVAIWMEESAAFDITPVQYAAIAAISAQPGIDATGLSEMINFDRSTLGDVLDRIEGRGWIKRRSVSADRRKKTLWLTPDGQEMFRRVTPLMYRVQQKLVEPLTAGESAKLVELLGRLLGLNIGPARSPK